MKGILLKMFEFEIIICAICIVICAACVNHAVKVYDMANEVLENCSRIKKAADQSLSDMLQIENTYITNLDDMDFKIHHLEESVNYISKRLSAPEN